ncbi:MAG: hypothetical protein D3909_13240, partial [Candidatus Electrothrix sp. ATG1]|nr:hypothetical protein [Candidatus Electrothrix sp. ATG1]
MQEECLKWWKIFLKERDDLTRPDGRELFCYRVTEQEYSELKRLLRKWLSALPRYDNLAYLSDDLLFCKLFVLYGAEWWRRRYDGSGFCWEPILHALQADPAAWTPQQRSRCIRNGFDGWRIQVRQHGGLRYILSVALQGGLPLRLLAEGRGGLGRLLKRVLQLAAGTSINRQDIEGWVESLHSMLPKSYRQPTIYLLLAEVVVTILRLKEEASLTGSADAVDRLDEQLPDWRNRFSLPLEDMHAQGLVAQLLRDAVEIRLEKSSLSFSLERCLEKIGDDWGLYSTISLPQTVQQQELIPFF